MAENSCCEALAIRRKLAESDPDQYLPDVASTLNCLGKLYSSMPGTCQAEEAFVEALEIRRRLSATAPQTHLLEVVATLGSLAEFYLSTKRTKMAAAQASEAERLLDPLWRAKPALYGDEMAGVLATRAQICESIMGSSAEAIAFARRAIEAAQDPALKEEIRLLIESLRPEQTP
jgi:tetratricopeptide (TPR) repeat protein